MCCGPKPGRRRGGKEHPAAGLSISGGGGPGLSPGSGGTTSKSKAPLLVVGSGAFTPTPPKNLPPGPSSESAGDGPIWDRGRWKIRFPSLWGLSGGQRGALPSPGCRSGDSCRGAGRLPPWLSGASCGFQESQDRAHRFRPLEIVQGIWPDAALNGDVRTVFFQLIKALNSKGFEASSAWLAEARRRDRAFRQKWIASPPQPAAPPTAPHCRGPSRAGE